MGSRVRLTVNLDGKWAVCVIHDQGPGISTGEQKQLFQKHTQLSARPTGGESSLGLGLSIVKRLAEAMGGTVTCQSALGEGATFTLRLRAIAQEPISMSAGKSVATPAPASRVPAG